jgi:hypothetical protein
MVRRKVDPETGKPSNQPNAISYTSFYSRKKVDPETGKPSNKPNAISYGAFKARRKVDPKTGKPSKKPNAFSYGAFCNRRKVDPETGEPSNKPNAISYSAFKGRRKVDPETGKPSNSSNAISYIAFQMKMKVDPETGKPSNKPNAISYSVFKGRRKVDPETGELSNKPDAISRTGFQMKKKVDPETGEPSNQPNAISYSAFKGRTKVDPETGEPSNKSDAIFRSVYHRKKNVDPETGKQSNQPNAIPYYLFQSRKKVDPETGESSDKPDAVPYIAFKNRKKVDPRTGKPSYKPNAISYSDFQNRKKVDPETGEPSNKPNAIPCSVFRSKRKVDPETGEPSSESNAIPFYTFQYRKKVAAKLKIMQPRENRDMDSDEDIPIKQEPDRIPDTNNPVLQLDREVFKEVATILRGNNDIPDNCVYLAEGFINYLKTGNMPSQPVPAKSASLEHLTFGYDTEKMPIQIKPEPGSRLTKRARGLEIETITRSVIDRNTEFGALAPVDETPQEKNGVTDLTVPPVYDVDYSTQKSTHASKLNSVLKTEARCNGGVSFGMVSLAPCGEIVEDLWHCIVYYATPTEVVYVDCQSKDPVFDNIENEYPFAVKKKSSRAEMFGNIVFYTPYCSSLVSGAELKEKEKTKKRKGPDLENNQTKKPKLDFQHSHGSDSQSPHASLARKVGMFANKALQSSDSGNRWQISGNNVPDYMEIDEEFNPKPASSPFQIN